MEKNDTLIVKTLAKDHDEYCENTFKINKGYVQIHSPLVMRTKDNTPVTFPSSLPREVVEFCLEFLHTLPPARIIEFLNSDKRYYRGLFKQYSLLDILECLNYLEVYL